MKLCEPTIPLPKNDPKLLARVEITSLGGFCLGGKPVQSGIVVQVERYVANDLIWRGKARLL